MIAAPRSAAMREQGTELAAVSVLVGSGGQVIGGIGSWATSIQGVSPFYLSILN